MDGPSADAPGSARCQHAGEVSENRRAGEEGSLDDRAACAVRDHRPPEATCYGDGLGPLRFSSRPLFVTLYSPDEGFGYGSM